ncbi:O-methyltransferase asqD [Fusarium oxysporum f. sp. conglutinans]|nr:O-methyltransferase asqD [Fusarium oxysporum f. sp. conglutinans]
MFRTLPSYRKHTGYRNPTDLNNCNWQFVSGSKENVFQSLVANPVAAREFSDAMESHSRCNLTPWPEIYPTGTLLANYKLDRPLVVDVGGSKSHDLAKFHIRHPNTLPHDFFTPQPVRGARAYFMHNVLRDWEDKEASQILKHIADAMEPGYSKFLIHESIINSAKPLARVTTSDIAMMACLGAKERTEDQWCQLIESVGLNVLKIWRPLKSMESIIEAELAQD